MLQTMCKDSFSLAVDARGLKPHAVPPMLDGTNDKIIGRLSV